MASEQTTGDWFSENAEKFEAGLQEIRAKWEERDTEPKTAADRDEFIDDISSLHFAYDGYRPKHNEAYQNILRIILGEDKSDLSSPGSLVGFLQAQLELIEQDPKT